MRSPVRFPARSSSIAGHLAVWLCPSTGQRMSTGRVTAGTFGREGRDDITPRWHTALIGRVPGPKHDLHATCRSIATLQLNTGCGIRAGSVVAVRLPECPGAARVAVGGLDVTKAPF